MNTSILIAVTYMIDARMSHPLFAKSAIFTTRVETGSVPLTRMTH